MKNLLTFIVFVAVLITCSCKKILLSEVEDPDKIYVNYSLIYEKNISTGTYQGRVHANVCLEGTGRPIQLDEGSNIKFNGQELTYADSLYDNQALFDPGEHHYEGWFPGLIEEAKFEFEDLDGNVYTNYAPLDSIGVPLGTNLTVQLGDSIELFWEGEPVGENEMVEVNSGWLGIGKFEQSQLNANSVWITTPDTLTMIIDSSGASLDTIMFPFLEQSFSISRRIGIGNLDAPSDKGGMSVRYRSSPYSLTLVE